MKVIHIISGLGNGGAEGVLYRLCCADNFAQHVVISLAGPGKYGAKLSEQNIRCYFLNFSLFSLVFKFFSLCKILLKEKPDVVQTWMYHGDFFGGVAAWLVGIERIIWNVRHSDLDPQKTKQSTIMLAKICALLSHFVPTRIVYCASKSKDVHEALGYKKIRGVIVRNGFDSSVFRPADGELIPTFHNFGLNRDVFTIGFVGRFSPEKDHKNLFQALTIMRNHKFDFRCVLVGDGINKKNASFYSLIRHFELQDVCILSGAVQDPVESYRSMDLHVLPSSSEGFPNVVAEAMGCGVPCVTTDAGDSKYIVGDTGWVVGKENPAELASAMLEAFQEMNDNYKDWELRKARCRERIVKDFSLKAMTDSYIKLWSAGRVVSCAHD